MISARLPTRARESDLAWVLLNAFYGGQYRTLSAIEESPCWPGDLQCTLRLSNRRRGAPGLQRALHLAESKRVEAQSAKRCHPRRPTPGHMSTPRGTVGWTLLIARRHGSHGCSRCQSQTTVLPEERRFQPKRGASWRLLGSDVSWGLLGSPGASWDLLGFLGVPWDLPGPLGTSWGFLGLQGPRRPKARKETCCRPSEPKARKACRDGVRGVQEPKTRKESPS